MTKDELGGMGVNGTTPEKVRESLDDFFKKRPLSEISTGLVLPEDDTGLSSGETRDNRHGYLIGYTAWIISVTPKYGKYSWRFNIKGHGIGASLSNPIVETEAK